MKFLTIDLGGTKALFLLWEGENILRQASIPSVEAFPLPEAIRRFLGQDTIEAAALAMAGPIEQGFCRLINLNRVVDCQTIRAAFPHIRWVFHNDLAAAAATPLLLPQTKQYILQTGEKQAGHIGVLAVGTGFGEGIMLKPAPGKALGQLLPGEGGHGDLCPATEEEWQLCRLLQQEYTHASWERALSGVGLTWIYRALGGQNPACLQNPAAITAQGKTDPLCQKAIHTFLGLLGAEAGNLALRGLTAGGIYLSGGVLLHLLPFVAESPLYSRFLAKGRYRAYLENIPLTILAAEETVGYGSAAILLYGE